VANNTGISISIKIPVFQLNTKPILFLFKTMNNYDVLDDLLSSDTDNESLDGFN